MTKNPFLELSIDELAIAWNNYSNLHGEDALDLESKAWLERCHHGKHRPVGELLAHLQVRSEEEESFCYPIPT